jgi:hypothetical protein
MAEASQSVTIQDKTPPTLMAPGDKIVMEGDAWTFDTPIATDASGEVTITVLDTITNTGPAITATCTWLATDSSGNTSQCCQTVSVESAGPITVSLTASAGNVYEGGEPARLEFSRTGSTAMELHVKLDFSGAAKNGVDFAELPVEIVIPAGARTVNLAFSGLPDQKIEKTEAAMVTITAGDDFELSGSSSATINVFDTTVKRK